jgi:phosphoglucosamine mutase
MSKYFGTDGIRGVANKELTAHIAYRIGRFLGQYKKNKTANNILIARDTRISGQLLLNGLVAGILSSGGNVTDLGISTTPSVAYLTRKKGFTFGIMISASHNPYYDNGIKLFKSNGEKIDKKNRRTS